MKLLQGLVCDRATLTQGNTEYLNQLAMTRTN